MKRQLLYTGFAAIAILCLAGCAGKDSDNQAQASAIESAKPIETSKPTQTVQSTEEAIEPTQTVQPTEEAEGERQVDYSYQWFKERIVQVVPEEIAVQFPDEGSCKWEGGYEAVANIRDADADYSEDSGTLYGSKLYFVLAFEGTQLQQYDVKSFEVTEERTEEDDI